MIDSNGRFYKILDNGEFKYFDNLHEIIEYVNQGFYDIPDKRTIECIPAPKNEEELKEYQEYLLSLINRIPNDKKANGYIDRFDGIYREALTEEMVSKLVSKDPSFLKFANPQNDNFEQLLDNGFSKQLNELGREKLTSNEKEMIRNFFINNAELGHTLDIRMLDSKIVDIIGIEKLEKMVRYFDIQSSIISLADYPEALDTFKIALDNLGDDVVFAEPLIEELSGAIHKNILFKKEKYNSFQYFDAITKKRNLEKQGIKVSFEENSYLHSITIRYDEPNRFLKLVSERQKNTDMPLSENEKIIISYLALNPKESSKITNYSDILNYVKNKSISLDATGIDKNSKLSEIKDAYFQRLIGLDIDHVRKLVTSYGNDPEELLKNYEDTDKIFLIDELSEKEALETIVKLRNVLECVDIEKVRNEYQKLSSIRKEKDILENYKKNLLLEKTLRRAYGRELVSSLKKESNNSQLVEMSYNDQKVYVRKLNGEFNRMVSLLGAYRDSAEKDGDMYDRWNTNKMAQNHALCYSLISQNFFGTAKMGNKTGVMVSINDFSPDSLVASAPYDLQSYANQNTVSTKRQQRFFASKNMCNNSRSNYSEYDIEIEDVLNRQQGYKKIQPASIICFEEVDEESIKAAAELSKKIGIIVPIEIIDRSELANYHQAIIMEELNKLKKSSDSSLVEDIIVRFQNVINSCMHCPDKLWKEIIGDGFYNANNFNKMISEILNDAERKINNGEVSEGIKIIEATSKTIELEKEKNFLLPNDQMKMGKIGINEELAKKLSELDLKYNVADKAANVNQIQSIKAIGLLDDKKFPSYSILIDSWSYNREKFKNQYKIKDVAELIDSNKIYSELNEVEDKGFYRKNSKYGEEHIARMLMFTDLISKFEKFDDKTRELLVESTKYYSCARLMDTENEKYGKQSAKMAEEFLKEKLTKSDLKIVMSAIEMQNQCWDIMNNRVGKFTIIDEEDVINKYKLSNEEKLEAEKIAYCIHDALKLDLAREAPKADRFNNGLDSFYGTCPFTFSSSNALVKFSFDLHDQLALQELTDLKETVGDIMDFESKEVQEEIKNFYREEEIGSYIWKKSPTVWLEYLKYKYPEVSNIDLNEYRKLKEKEKNRYQEKEFIDKQIIQQQVQQEEDKKQLQVLYDKKVEELNLGGERTLEDLTKEELKMLKRNVDQVQEQEEIQSKSM